MNDGLRATAAAALADMTAAGTLKTPPVLDAAQGPLSRLRGDTRDVLVACSNDYLGLAADPRVVAATADGLHRYGAGTASVRFICGTFTPHVELERDIAELVGAEAALTFVSCWDANAAAITTLADERTAIFSDALNHASIIDAIRLSRAGHKAVYPHVDLTALEEALSAATGWERRIVVTDGVFSMEGDIAPLADLVELCRRHDAVLMVDDSHGVGVMGDDGRGTPAAAGVLGEIDVLTGTLGKALGGAAGGYVASCTEVVDLLAQVARPSLFSNALPVPTACGAREAVRILRTEPQRVARLHRVVADLRTGLTGAGLTPLSGPTAIVPIIVGDTARVGRMSARLRDEYGVLVTGFGYPVVPEGTARLRVQANAAMTDECVARLVTAIAAVAGG
ncbi:aminotransferase class I/II-fold pyridoxal phosphate-dependent enzyme [Mycolicibacterium phlei]|uniref:aminotransferase class I/II-fold pyridoxal phosphate-dependent enzyme n=1 Tax=Mycolicibacterium phlei TaxID=1771 RepID=UPI00025AF28A|nr:aminotransferase class I/II-fold pyridoxal phosphate-dependent enzyme [Mycolicibacterium phlei]EID11625.1 glycine C-acetyltransferase [Mycolicibacterium phlei RIVM601174]MBF4194300.1 glycine C-acetyltransferase [Mycolicibacterium phlei]